MRKFKKKFRRIRQDLHNFEEQIDAFVKSCSDKNRNDRRFYRGDPPTRNGSTVIYNDSYQGSLQDAYEELSEGDRLYIDPCDSPYTDRITLLEDPKDHITIDGGGKLEFNEDGTYNVVSSGAEIHHPDDGTEHVIGTLDSVSGSSPEFGMQTELRKPVSGGGFADQGVNNDIGNTTLHVSDASKLSGKEKSPICIKEYTRPYQEPTSGDAGAPGTTYETNILKSIDVDNDTIELEFPVYQDYPLVSSTEVGTIHHQISDIHITGLNLVGGVSDVRPLVMMGIYEGWIDNILIENAVDEHAGLQANSSRMHYENIAIEGTDRYGLALSRGTIDSYLSNIYGSDTQSYVVRHGSSSHDKGHSSAGTLIEGIRGENMGDGIVANAHWGGFYFEIRNMKVGEGARTQRFRSRNIVIRGADVNGNARVITHAQRPHSCLATGLTISLSDTSQMVFDFSSLGSDSIYGNQQGVNLRYEDIEIESYGNKDITDIGQFGNVEINGLHFKNVMYDGRPLTEEDVKQWDEWDRSTVTNLTVEQ